MPRVCQKVPTAFPRCHSPHSSQRIARAVLPTSKRVSSISIGRRGAARPIVPPTAPITIAGAAAAADVGVRVGADVGAGVGAGGGAGASADLGILSPPVSGARALGTAGCDGPAAVCDRSPTCAVPVPSNSNTLARFCLISSSFTRLGEEPWPPGGTRCAKATS